jgi:phosphoglycolate phosphatase-like HAD superfamily hydrolase
VLAIDVDGVVLDYAAAYRQAWARAFGILPDERDPQAYWPLDRWAVRRLDGEEKRHFRRQFDEAFWSTIPALPGAVEACERLVNAGYDLYFVTAIKHEFAQARLTNLLTLNIQVTELIATPMSEGAGNPKAEIINTLNPAGFVDDYAPYLRNLKPSIHKALIQRHPNGSPNVGDDRELADSLHDDLMGFAWWWLNQPRF